MEAVTGYCRIKNRTIVLNGKLLFQEDAGSLEIWLERAYDFLKFEYPRFYKMDPLSKLGFIAAELILKGDTLRKFLPSEIGIVLSNKHASLDTDNRYHEASKIAPSPGLFVYTLANIVTGEIAIRHCLKGENAFFIAESFDANMLTEYVHELLDTPFTKACIAGWTDVLEDHHDVLVYLVEKEAGNDHLPHSAEQLNLLYRN